MIQTSLTYSERGKASTSELRKYHVVRTTFPKPLGVCSARALTITHRDEIVSGNFLNACKCGTSLSLPICFPTVTFIVLFRCVHAKLSLSLSLAHSRSLSLALSLASVSALLSACVRALSFALSLSLSPSLSLFLSLSLSLALSPSPSLSLWSRLLPIHGNLMRALSTEF